MEKYLPDYEREVEVVVDDQSSEIVEKRKIQASIIKDLPVKDDGRIVSPEYCLKLIETDIYIFDIRYWPNDITEDEARKKFESGKWGNCGHFEWAMRGYVKQGGTFEQVWDALQKNKVKAIEEFIEYNMNYLKRILVGFKEERDNDKDHIRVAADDERILEDLCRYYNAICAHMKFLDRPVPSFDEVAKIRRGKSERLPLKIPKL